MLSRGYDPDDLRGAFALVQTSAPTAEPLSLAQAKAHLRVDFTDDDVMIAAYITAARTLIEDLCGICLVKQSWAFSFQNWFRWEIALPRAYPLIGVDSITYHDVNDAVQTLDPVTVYQVSKTTRPGRIRPFWNQVWPSLFYRMDAVTVNLSGGYLLPATVDIATDTVTCAWHPYANGDIVRVYNTDNSYYTGLAAATPYYVVSAATGTLKLSLTSGGSAIDISGTVTAGSNTFLYQQAPPEPIIAAIKLLVGHLYENRQEVVVETGRATVEQIPMGIKALIAPYRDYGL